MDLVREFIERYEREFDFLDQAARLSAQLLERSLQNAGIRALVTSRAKSPSRLEEKVRQRSKEKSYGTVQDIFDDIVDLAGIRVALYFPAERDQVGNVIRQIFNLREEPKTFPGSSKPPNHEKRFSGYWATHYRASIKDMHLGDAQKRYAQAAVEIQVASVLMHAWAEVEHDLVYKPLQGQLSADEYALLDQLNGMVLAGEIALEQLQAAGKKRVAEHDRKFSSHYDLADYLLDRIGPLFRKSDPEALLGRVDVLFRLANETGLQTPQAIEPYIETVHSDFERRPLADQIIDLILSDDPSRYGKYRQLRLDALDRRDPDLATADPDTARAMGRFLASWVKFENLLRKGSAHPVATGRAIGSVSADESITRDLQRIRQFRNHLVHGIEIPDPAAIDLVTEELEAILAKLGRRPRKR